MCLCVEGVCVFVCGGSVCVCLWEGCQCWASHASTPPTPHAPPPPPAQTHPHPPTPPTPTHPPTPAQTHPHPPTPPTPPPPTPLQVPICVSLGSMILCAGVNWGLARMGARPALPLLTAPATHPHLYTKTAEGERVCCPAACVRVCWVCAGGACVGEAARRARSNHARLAARRAPYPPPPPSPLTPSTRALPRRERSVCHHARCHRQRQRQGGGACVQARQRRAADWRHAGQGVSARRACACCAPRRHTHPYTL